MPAPFGASLAALLLLAEPSGELAWPPVERTTRPWTRWWWLGSAVDEANLTRLLETYRAAGLGGVEITLIYGVKGQEARDIPYLSDRWLAVLRHTLTEAERLDLGVDLPSGTGWPFGGPGVGALDDQDRLTAEAFDAAPGRPVRWAARGATIWALEARAADGRRLDLRAELRDGQLDWQPADGSWTVYAVALRSSGMKVKRAAPGGEGRCVNPFSRVALLDYLSRFDRLFAALPAGAIRCQFHDSYEYQANASPRLLAEFRRRRGYDLLERVPEFCLRGDPDLIARVRTDYRQTVSELLLEEFCEPWRDWARAHGCLARNQAHGSPGNLLDLYGAVDIPETEVFRGDGDPRVQKFASSAAHVMGRPLVSAESLTWQGEHFQVTLGESKQELDRLLVAGINHLFYHGTAYSPADAPWPGWLFYASTHVEPNNPWWRDLPALNAYLTRCQSFLQTGRPDNDLLVYFPLADLWHRQPRLFQFVIEPRWLEGQPFGDCAGELWRRGYAFDYVSDRQLTGAEVLAGRVTCPGADYRAVLVPPCRLLPETTFADLLRLAEAGATVVFVDGLPQDVPGLGDLDRRRAELAALTARLSFGEPGAGYRAATVGAGRVLVGPLVATLAAAGITPEPIAARPGVQALRRALDDGHVWFVVNQGQTPLEDWFALGRPASAAALYDPWTGAAGLAATRWREGALEIYLRLDPGASLLVRSWPERLAGPPWPYPRPAGPTTELTGPWTLTFVAGGPTLPADRTLTTLGDWTALGDDLTGFAGTGRYRLTFDAPAPGEQWRLDLGDIRDSARIYLNGRLAGTLVAAPWQLTLRELKARGNVLEVEVTNVAANRIRDLDRRGVPWRIFRDINLVNIDYKPFDASGWPLRPAGLLGPVTLTPLTPETPA